jgi:hypothetical protein
MIELASVLIILFLFVFPLPTLITSLGLLTTWGLYRKYETFHNQPLEGKKSLFLGLTMFLANTICSIAMGTALAFGVYYFIYDSFYLLIFNFIFCTAVSLRWFDFTYNIYRLFIFKLKPFKTNALVQSYFVICQGFRERDGKGFGLAPVYTDAGILELHKSKVIFKGVFCEETFGPSNIIKIEAKSSEKLRIHTNQNNPKSPDIYLITLKDQFYPFKSRPDRDKIFHSLSFDTKVSETS